MVLGGQNIVSGNNTSAQTILAIPLANDPLLNFSAPITRSGWTVSASSVGGGAAGNAIDGNSATSWQTTGNLSNTDFFHIDSGASQTFGAVCMDMSNKGYLNFPSSGTVQTSPDDSTWTTRGSWSGGVPQNSQSVFNINFAPVTARYIRLLSTSNTGSDLAAHPWAIEEINAYPGTPNRMSQLHTAFSSYFRSSLTLSIAKSLPFRFNGVFFSPSSVNIQNFGFYIGPNIANCIGFFINGGQMQYQLYKNGNLFASNTFGPSYNNANPGKFEMLFLPSANGVPTVAAPNVTILTSTGTVNSNPDTTSNLDLTAAPANIFYMLQNSSSQNYLSLQFLGNSIP